MAGALGGDWSFTSPADVMREIAEMVPTYKGISYDKLENGGVQWPCLSTDCTGNAHSACRRVHQGQGRLRTAGKRGARAVTGW